MIDEKELTKEMTVFEKKVAAIVVQDKASYELAGNMIFQLDTFKKQIEEYWFDPVQKALQAHKALVAKRDEMLNPIKARRTILTQKMSVWSTEDDRKRRIEQARLDAERRAAEEKERARLAKLAEKAEAKGQEEKAEALREKAEDVFIPQAIVQPEVEKSVKTDSGTITQTKDIVIEITDELEVIKAIASELLPIGIVTISNSKLKAAVKLIGMKTVPGCRITEEIKQTFRGK
jgi:hypothetical protein